MSDEHVHLDGEGRSLLAELWETPVGRRWVLKAGLASAALGVGLGGATGSAEAAPTKKRRRTETTDLHFVLGHVHGVSRLTVQVNGERTPLVRHTKASREALRRRGGLWQVADLSKLSHHVTGVKLRADQGTFVSVHGRRGKREVLVAQMWHAPRATTISLARAAHRATGSFKHVLGSASRLAELGVKPAEIRSAEHLAQLATVVDPYLTAAGMVGMHPNIATKNSAALAVTNTVLGQTSAVTTLAKAITRLQQGGKDIAASVEAKNPDGTPAQIKLGDTTTTFTTLQLNPQKDKGFIQALPAALMAGIGAVRNNANLGAVIDQPLDQEPQASTQTWVQSQGVIPQSQPYSQTLKAGSAISIQVKNPGVVYGTQIKVNGAYSNGQVPLKLYNNWVRWIWVYVQYLGPNDVNLSANPNATFPDTKYAQSLGLLPQVFTVLGVPLWNTNTIDVTLNFPEGAHTARILFCGLGSNLNDGGWQQYFPAGAYPNAIAPTDEVLVPGLLTGILTIGMTAFALVSDIDIAATWALVNGEIKSIEPALATELSEILRTAAIRLTRAESLAASIAAGAATYTDITSNGGSLTNIWNTLLGLVSVIPKVIFSPGQDSFWLKVAADIIGGFAGFRLANAIPFIGEVIGIIETLGDAATLAEVCAETIIAPWVIENEVNVTYPATVTINRDPRDATFPATARNWQLEAKVDGAVVLTPITGTVNPNGQLETGPLVLTGLTAPFGGKTIQWSVVFTNQTGQQVGTGVSAQFPNNNPSNPASEVSITITELPATVDAKTVFTRTVTTGYSTAAGGYTWSNQIADTGTVQSSGIQQVTGAAVSTLAGVAGVVWEQGNKFYVRGVPVAENGSTISLGLASKEGYTRRPFLLLDAFVNKTDQGNHVLLEPDPSTPAYHVRKVTLDPTTGAPTWDSTVSYGTFLVPVSAAALHSSGRVVAISTDSGRFAWLQPVSTPNPVQAAYSAGSGTQTGLLSSPIAIAVTNPGLVFVLDAATSQISAFDLNGNPVPYFQATLTRRSLVARPRRGASGPGTYTLPLVSKGTYLDIAVDGSGQIYLLYHTGDGSAPSDYHVDVYTATGEPLDTASPGVNVPHLAVDYWRSIFAANFDPLDNIATGKPQIDPALGVAEPSVSRFDPVEAAAIKRTKAKPKHGHKPKPKHS